MVDDVVYADIRSGTTSQPTFSIARGHGHWCVTKRHFHGLCHHDLSSTRNLSSILQVLSDVRHRSATRRLALLRFRMTPTPLHAFGAYAALLKPLECCNASLPGRKPHRQLCHLHGLHRVRITDLYGRRCDRVEEGLDGPRHENLWAWRRSRKIC